MIEFETPQAIAQERQLLQETVAGEMRAQARYYDEHEHEIPWDYINSMWQTAQASGRSYRGSALDTDIGDGTPTANQRLSFMVEMLSWGDAGLYLCTPGRGLGGAAIEATGTPEQKRKFLTRFSEAKPVWSCMAMTEPHCGSDTAAIRTRAVKDGDGWVINGHKIFVTCGHKALVDSQGFVVVWATIDPGAGRAGMRPFVVEAGTPGMTLTRLEYKMGIRASDTAELVFDKCRVPAENMLGGEEIAAREKGFKGAMATFDATRPIVAASALGIARAALDLVKELLAAQGIAIPYGIPRTQLSAIQRDVLEMEAMIHAAWLLTLKATWLMDERKPNTLEASMCKIKAGEVVTRVTQKAVELLGPLGYSRQLLLEKMMRDAKINDLFEGTGQINRLVVARRILGYRSRDLK